MTLLEKIGTALFSLVGAFAGYGVWQLINRFILRIVAMRFGLPALTNWQEAIVQLLFVAFFAFLGYWLSPLIFRGGSKLANNIEHNLQQMTINELLSAVAGTIIGLILAYLICTLFHGVFNSYLEAAIDLVIYVFLGYLGYFIFRRRSKEINLRRLRTESTERTERGERGERKKRSSAIPKVLDTSVIIDGRIVDIIESGFLEGPFLIPEFVLIELQHLADSSDSLKRAKGRRGLEILNRMQEKFGIEIFDSSAEKGIDEIPEVDLKLLRLAQNRGGKLLTTDYNLNKVAGIRGVPVLNINHLANVLRPRVIPGESLQVDILREGTEEGQGVAYLEDGTMVVVEDGKDRLGGDAEITVTAVRQTSAGRMVFAKLA